MYDELEHPLQNGEPMLRLTYSSLLFATLAACAADPDATGGAGGKADGAVPVIRLGADWTESTTGNLVAGSAVRIDYALDRLTDCRGSTNGSEVWGVSGYASFDGRAPVTFGLSRLDGGVVKPVVAELDIPANATSVEMWFAVNNRWGCIAYDSNLGGNYTFEIAPHTRGAVLSFEADWSESQSEPLRAGDEIVIHYDPARLAQCATTRNGNAAWLVTAHYRVDGGPIKALAVTTGRDGALQPSDPSLIVPRGRELVMWFQATSVHGCNAYDSNLGANYTYSIR
jgi:hypothetical protein